MDFLAEHWPWFVAGAVLLLIVIIVVAVLVRRRRRRPAAPALPPLDLRRAWRTFIRRMPREHQRVLPLFRPFVVLGEAGAGKTTLIDRRTDWRGQAALFHPSYTDDPLLQVYQAARGVVQELSPAVLGDATPRARRALLALWRPLRRHKDPRVVVALSAASLRSAVPDALVKQAQAVRGKVDILAEAVGRPVKVTIALTFMDQVEGFAELATVAHDRELPLAFEAGETPELRDLVAAFAPLHAWLPAVLRDQSAQAWLGAVSFVDGLPELLRPLSVFIDTLQGHHPLTATPAITAIGLTSKHEGASAAWNPFACAITREEARRFQPWRRHLAAAAALVLVIGGGLYAAYSHERSALERGLQRVDAYVDDFRNPDARATLLDDVAALKGSPLRPLTPSFFDDDEELGERLIHERLLAQIRSGILEPRLRRMTVDEPVAALYMLNLLTAGAGNTAARTILAEVEEWSSVLGLPPQVIIDFIDLNRRPDRYELPMDDAAFAARFSTPALHPREHDAAELARQVVTAMGAPLIERARVDELRTRGLEVLADLDAARDVDRVARVASLLNDTTRRRYGEAWIAAAREAPRTSREDVEALVQMLGGTDLSVRGDVSTLAGLIEAVEAIGAEGAAQPRTLRFDLGDAEVVVERSDWDAAVKRTRLTRLLTRFVDSPRETSAAMFFGAATYPPVRLADPGGRFFGGAGVVDGVYTARAFNERVRPVLEKLPEVLAGLTVADATRDAVLAAVKAAAQEHAEGYGDAWATLYASFGYSADSALSLKLVLTELTRPKSPLRRMLQEVSKGSDIVVAESNELLEPYAVVVDAFAFVRAIVPKPGESSPVLDEYFAIVAKMVKELGADAKAPEKDEKPGLVSALSPLGRMALSMYLDEESSALNQLDAWLSTSEVPGEWQAAFDRPPLLAYRIGIGEVEAKVEQAWDDAIDTFVSPVKMAFPFLPVAETAATAEEVEAALHPKGSFWTTIDSMIGPLLRKRGEAWELKSSRLGRLALPSEIVPSLNRLEPLKSRFWDSKGKPRPLVFKARPLPLPGDTQSQYATVMSHMQVEDAWVYGLNQRPDWTELKVSWWKAGAASVGAAFALGAEGSKVYRGTSRQDVDWGVFHLLQAAERHDEKALTWEWRVPSAVPGRSVIVGFQLDRNPWGLLGLDDTRKVRGR